jgi:hypothetical protein
MKNDEVRNTVGVAIRMKECGVTERIEERMENGL